MAFQVTSWAERRQAALAEAGRRLASLPWRRVGLVAATIAGGLLVTLVLALLLADWNALRGPIARFASNAAGRPIEIRGDLDVDPFSLAPRARVGDLVIGNRPPFQDRPPLASIRETEVAVRLLPLFLGRLEIVRIDLAGAELDLYRNADGLSNWSGAERPERPFRLPPIRRFTASDGRLSLRDETRGLALDARFETEQSGAGTGAFALEGEGRLNQRRFTLRFSGAPLINVRRNRPYPFTLRAQMAQTTVRATGTIARPFDLARFSAAAAAEGPDLADLYHLTGVTLPNSPPYRLTAQIERDGARTALTGIEGTIGDSDVAGALTAEKPPGGRLFLSGDIRSRSLDLDDLVAVLGGAPDPRETASAAQRREAAALREQRRLLPDADLDIRRVRDMDAKVAFTAGRVRSRTPVRALSGTVTLDRGLLRIDPLSVTLEPGRLGGAVSIDARGEGPPRVALDVRLSQARLETWLSVKGSPAITGALFGRAELSGRGFSVREAAASADGRVSLYTPEGEVREAFAELTGVNVTRGLGLLLTGDRSKIDVRCGVADFRVRNGVAQGATIVMDTETMLIGGEGAFSLRNETLDLRIQGEPKEPRLIRLAAPITVRGPVRDPRVGVEAGAIVREGGLAALLAAVAAPIAAVLPFVDVGLAEDANCGALIARARRAS